MRTVPLGNTGVDVSALCLGAMYFGTRNDERTSFELLDQYVAAGGTFIDTANIYAHWVEGGQGGESESLLGRWMKARGNRADLFLASKVGFNMPGVERGLTAAQIEAECEKSLRRMGVETIDLYYAHVDDRVTPLDETLAAFDRLVRAGKVRFIGASNYLAWRLEQAHWVSKTHDWASFCCVQQRYTYLRPKPGAASTRRFRQTTTCSITSGRGGTTSRCWPIRRCWAGRMCATTAPCRSSTGGRMPKPACACCARWRRKPARRPIRLCWRG